MKRSKTILVSLLLPMISHAQQIVYGYDATGNRISRHVANNGSQAPLRTSLENIPNNTTVQTISIDPNPTTGLLTVTLSSFGMEDTCNLLLVNMTGQTLIKQSMTSSQTTLDLTHYACGYYLLKVNLNENVTTYKIIKK